MNFQPILGITESSNDTEQNGNTHSEYAGMSVDLNSKIFNHHNTAIPDFSEVVTDTENDERRYYCMATKAEQRLHETNGRVENEAIDEIVRKLNDDKRTKHVKDADDPESTKYVTNSKFTSVFSDVSVDLLAMVNLVRGLNAKVAEHAQNRQNLHIDVCGLVEDNKKLRESLARLKVESDRRYDTMCKQYDAKFEELYKHLKFTTKITNPDNGVTYGTTYNETSKGLQKGIRKLKTDVMGSAQAPVKITTTRIIEDDEPVEEDTQTNYDDQPEQSVDNNEQSTDQNIYIDRQLEKRLPKQRSAPMIRKTGTPDTFGDVQINQNGPVIGIASRQQVRRENAENTENAVKQLADSKTLRANRLKLTGSTQSDKSPSRRM
jgi:hypothetical protein